MSSATAELIIKLRDEASKQAGAVAKALGQIAAQERAVGAQSAEMQKLTRQLSELQSKAQKADIFAGARRGLAETRAAFNQAQDQVRRAAANMAAATEENSNKMARALTRAQREVRQTARAYEQAQGAAKAAYRDIGGGVRGATDLQAKLTTQINATTAAIERQAAAERQMAAAAAKVNREQVLRDGRRRMRGEAAGVLTMVTALKAGEVANDLARGTLHTYKEFDNERRFGGAVMGATYEQQLPLINQAIRLGASTRYNDVQVLEAQRELAARGVGRPAILGMIGPSTTLGQSLDLDLPSAVRQLEGAIFGFKKDISTVEAATDAARQTADLQVKAAKISGMTPEDILQVYKYGSTPARLSGVSEETLLAFGAISKKANIGGDEAGVAFRALMAAAQNPTRGAREAMLANGIDYSKYQRSPDRIDVDAFSKNVAAQFGVALSDEAKASLTKVFTDKALIADPSKFTPAVMQVLDEALGGDDAKSKRSIAGMANRYRNASMQGVDVNALITDLMAQMGGNLQFANAIFGSKQGGRIATALGDPTVFLHMIDELQNHSKDYAQTVSDERMAGFSGAVDRLEGSVKNLETAIGRALDNDGQGGLLTGFTNVLGQTVQHLAELNPTVLALGSVVGIAAGKVAEFSAAWGLVNVLLEFKASTALTASAASLEGAAVALTRAAGAQGGAAAAAGPAGAAAAGGMTWTAFLGRFAAPLLGATAIAQLTTPDEDKRLAAADQAAADIMSRVGPAVVNAARSAYQPWWAFGDRSHDADYVARYLGRGRGPQPMTATLSSAHTISTVDPLAMERASRAAADYRADPEAARGRAAMQLHALDETKAKADAAGSALDGLNATVAPKVDTSGLDAALAKLRAIASGIDDVNARAKVSAAVSSIGRELRGSYADVGLAYDGRGDF